MQKRTLQGHLTSIESRAALLARYKDAKGFDAYVRSDLFVESLMSLDPDRRSRAMRAINEAAQICGSTLRPIPKSGTIKVMSWKDSPENQQRVRDAWARHKSDKGVARELNVPLSVAKSARWRFVGPIRPKSARDTGAAATQEHAA